MVTPSIPMILLRHFPSLQAMAMQSQAVDSNGWKIYVTKDEYGYIKRRRTSITRRLFSRLIVSNIRVSLFKLT